MLHNANWDCCFDQSSANVMRRVARHACLCATALMAVVASGMTSFAQSGLESAEPRRWVAVEDALSIRASPSLHADVTGSVSRGAILSNLGCQDLGGEIWCAVRPFRGGPKGFVPATQLRAAVGPDGTIATGRDDSKARARRHNFDAEDKIPCAQEQGQTLGTCRAAVARSGGGDATVVVTFSNGFSRELYFTHGEFIRGSSTMSGVGTDTDWRADENVYSIRVDDQRFEVPVELVIGK